MSKQKALGSDSRANQQTIFTGKIKATEEITRVIIYYILEKSKETMSEFFKGTTKVLNTNCIQMVEYSKVSVELSDT